MALITLKTTKRDANLRIFDGHLSDIRPDYLNIKMGDTIRYEVWDDGEPTAHSVSAARFRVTCVIKNLPMVEKGFVLIDMVPITPRFD